MTMPDDDLVMESTTDSPDQIAEGLGVDLGGDEGEAAPVEAAEGEASAEGDPGAGTEGDVAEDAGAETDEPAGEVTPSPARVATDGKRPQKKSANAAAAAARRTSSARNKVLEEENAALRERLKELATGTPAPAAPKQAAPVAPVQIKPEEIGDDYPEVAEVVGKLTALGPKPKSDDFEDFTEFEAKKDEWIEKRASLNAELNFVRRDVAQRESIAQADANRAAKETADRFAETVNAARARHEDYDEKMDEARDNGLILRHRDLAQALMESEIGGDVMFHLVTNPAEITRLNGLSPHRALAELGKIEGRVQAGLRPLRQQPAAQTPGRRVSKAPDPQGVLLGDLTGRASSKDLNDPNLSMADYNRLRDAQDEASGRRRPIH